MKPPKRSVTPRLNAFLFGIASTFSDGFMLMLLLGGLHSQDHAVPALGYLWCIFTAFVVSALVDSPLTEHEMKHNLPWLYSRLGRREDAVATLDDIFRSRGKS